MSRLALIIPTRGRPENIVELTQALEDTASDSTDLYLVLDDDDEMLGGYLLQDSSRFLKHIFIYPRNGKGMAKPLNRASNALARDYKYFAFMGDDHRPRTLNWDKDFIDVLDDLGTGLVYGNDLHQGNGLPTAVAMTQDIVRELEGMVPPDMIHLYLDNFWLRLGQDLNSIAYLDHVIIEHCHPIWGTAKSDKGYEEVNAQEIYDADRVAFEKYVGSHDYQVLLNALR